MTNGEKRRLIESLDSALCELERGTRNIKETREKILSSEEEKPAQEQFEALGFTLYEDREQITYNDEQALAITFYKQDKKIEISICKENKKHVVNYSFSLEELQAIDRQRKELGWL